MSLTPRRILVVSDDQMLRTTRVSILEKAGYAVCSAATADDAMGLLETESFDLILLGQEFRITGRGLDQRLREKYSNLLTLRIQPTDDMLSLYLSRTTDSLPEHVLSAVWECWQLNRKNDHDS
jgi:DNA-binding response OmpR family regulator